MSDYGVTYDNETFIEELLTVTDPYASDEYFCSGVKVRNTQVMTAHPSQSAESEEEPDVVSAH